MCFGIERLHKWGMGVLLGMYSAQKVVSVFTVHWQGLPG